MHFCVSTARRYGRVPVPRNTSLNWFMPALANSSVGSSRGTTGLDGTIVWPCRLMKKSRNCWRTSFALGMMALTNGTGYADDADQADSRGSDNNQALIRACLFPIRVDPPNSRHPRTAPW